MAQYTITLYKNTGFDAVNLPDAPSLVGSFASIEAPFLYLKQDTFLTSVKIEMQYDDMIDIDYAKIGDVYYFVTNLTMLNNNVCSIDLLEDSFTTLGGINGITIIDGWCTRRHVNSDNIFDNIIPEDFAPQNQMDTDFYQVNIGQYASSYNLVASTVDLTSEELGKADVYVGEATESDYSVTVPSTPPLTKETKIYIKVPDGEEISGNYPNVGLYRFDTPVIQNAVRKLRSLGLESVIVGCYKIPQFMVQSIKYDTTAAFVEEIHGVGISSLVGLNPITSAQLQYKYGTYQPKNNKVYSQYNAVRVYSPISGDVQTFEMNEIYDPSLTDMVLKFSVFVDCGAEGIPYLRPTYYDRKKINIINMFINTIKGANWLNTPIAFTNPSGSSINAANFALVKSAGQQDWSQYQLNNFTRIGDTVFDDSIAAELGNVVNLGAKGIGNVLAGNIAGAGGSALGLIKKHYSLSNPDYEYISKSKAGAYNLGREAQSKILAYEVSQNLNAPQINFCQGPTLQLFFGNVFNIISVHLTDSDLERFDKYLTQYGYKVSEPLTNECFRGRQNYNFVEGKGVTILSKSKYANRVRRQNAQSQIEGGIRLWHVKPSLNARYDNPIVGGNN